MNQPRQGELAYLDLGHVLKTLSPLCAVGVIIALVARIEIGLSREVFASI
jgi:hypothetical protein